jgi:hypothetical protein
MAWVGFLINRGAEVQARSVEGCLEAPTHLLHLSRP